MLTYAQAELLAFIKEYQSDFDGVSPSFEEMKDGIYLKSKSGVHRLISALVERGFIRRLPNRARALEVIEQVPPPPPTGLALYTSQMLIAELAARSARARREQEVTA